MTELLAFIGLSATLLLLIGVYSHFLGFSGVPKLIDASDARGIINRLAPHDRLQSIQVSSDGRVAIATTSGDETLLLSGFGKRWNLQRLSKNTVHSISENSKGSFILKLKEYGSPVVVIHLNTDKERSNWAKELRKAVPDITLSPKSNMA